MSLISLQNEAIQAVNILPITFAFSPEDGYDCWNIKSQHTEMLIIEKML